jgi:hypothetical protein
MRRILCAAFAALFVSCASAPIPRPTPTRPISMCHVSCPESGFLFRAQHLCRGGKRWFEDFRAIGEFVTRSVDGTIDVARWIACIDGWKPDGSCARTADFEKADVIPRSCSEVIREIVQSRSVSERGAHPGEPDPLHP